MADAFPWNQSSKIPASEQQATSTHSQRSVNHVPTSPPAMPRGFGRGRGRSLEFHSPGDSEGEGGCFDGIFATSIRSQISVDHVPISPPAKLRGFGRGRPLQLQSPDDSEDESDYLSRNQRSIDHVPTSPPGTPRGLGRGRGKSLQLQSPGDSEEIPPRPDSVSSRETSTCEQTVTRNMAAASTQDEDLTCSLCLDIFTNPKILPNCLHTFCETCLQALIDKTNGPKFPCPSCREEVQVPAGGASVFKTNPYIKQTDLEKARRGLVCAVHVKRDLELFCEDCKSGICVMCKLTTHHAHKTEDIQEVIDKTRAMISDDRTRLAGSVAEIKKRIDEVEEEKGNLKTKQDLLVKDIHGRHATVVAAADKIRDESLATLTKVIQHFETKLTTLSAEMKKNLAEVENLYKKAKDSQTIFSVSELLTTAREMREGSGSNTAIEKLIPKPLAAVTRPVLQCEKADEDIVDSVKEFVGTVVPRGMEVCKPDVEVKEHITCSNGKPNCQVFSLCPEKEDRVWVFYASSALSGFMCYQKFDKNGQTLSRKGDVTAEINCKYVDGVAVHSNSSYIRYAKSDKLWKLCHTTNETIEVRTIQIISSHPRKSRHTTIFTIKCGKHRACDIDSSETWVAVVEEVKIPDTQNKVKLFMRPASSALLLSQEAVDIYEPPNPDCFQPMDVCFYKLGGEELLLVADELDAIHVIRVSSGRFKFVRYLNPTCPLIVRPTAMNVDPLGRLWVACQGGRILICTPLLSSPFATTETTASAPSAGATSISLGEFSFGSVAATSQSTTTSLAPGFRFGGAGANSNALASTSAPFEFDFGKKSPRNFNFALGGASSIQSSSTQANTSAPLVFSFGYGGPTVPSNQSSTTLAASRPVGLSSVQPTTSSPVELSSAQPTTSAPVGLSSQPTTSAPVGLCYAQPTTSSPVGLSSQPTTSAPVGLCYAQPTTSSPVGLSSQPTTSAPVGLSSQPTTSAPVGLSSAQPTTSAPVGFSSALGGPTASTQSSSSQSTTSAPFRSSFASDGAAATHISSAQSTTSTATSQSTKPFFPPRFSSGGAGASSNALPSTSGTVGFGLERTVAPQSRIAQPSTSAPLGFSFGLGGLTASNQSSSAQPTTSSPAGLSSSAQTNTSAPLGYSFGLGGPTATSQSSSAQPTTSSLAGLSSSAQTNTSAPLGFSFGLGGLKASNQSSSAQPTTSSLAGFSSSAQTNTSAPLGFSFGLGGLQASNQSSSAQPTTSSLAGFSSSAQTNTSAPLGFSFGLGGLKASNQSSSAQPTTSSLAGFSSSAQTNMSAPLGFSFGLGGLKASNQSSSAQPTTSSPAGLSSSAQPTTSTPLGPSLGSAALPPQDKTQ